jgi:tRNA-splicing ligase RtcB
MSPREAAPRVLSWASVLEDEALRQAARTARLPFLTGHLALMPDAHFGRGSTVGSVIPTAGAIIPAAVGVDIGCGMIAAELPFTSDLLGDDLDELHARIARVVPAGVGKGHALGEGRLPNSAYKGLPPLNRAATSLTPKQETTAFAQFGTLGSGNHFVEVCLDERDVVWVVLHSGSRGIGNQLAKVHIEGAKGLMRQMFVHLEDPDLAYLAEGTSEFEAYVTDMLWAQDYALGNREAMLGLVLRQVAGRVGHDFQVGLKVNCHHNYTEREHHGGRNVWLTRKGAIRAREGDLGVVPGSMGTASYVVRGLGNAASYNSCAHGAGRRMSRGEARRTLDQDGLAEAMAGKAWNNDARALLDEDPRAYKDIDRVMADQADLAEVVHTLTQVLNYKGT